MGAGYRAPAPLRGIRAGCAGYEGLSIIILSRYQCAWRRRLRSSSSRSDGRTARYRSMAATSVPLGFAVCTPLAPAHLYARLRFELAGVAQSRKRCRHFGIALHAQTCAVCGLPCLRDAFLDCHVRHQMLYGDERGGAVSSARLLKAANDCRNDTAESSKARTPRIVMCRRACGPGRDSGHLAPPVPHA